jgi:hypothetical protein
VSTTGNWGCARGAPFARRPRSSLGIPRCVVCLLKCREGPNGTARCPVWPVQQHATDWISTGLGWTGPCSRGPSNG